jgi:cell division transport system permease protein
LREFTFFLQEAWSSLRRNLAASLAAVTAIGAVLFLLSLLMLVSHNILVLADNLGERKGLSVFLDTDIAAERISELEHHFSGFREVDHVRLVTRAEALRDLESELGTPGIAETLGGNPLPDVFLIRPRVSSSDAATLARLAQEMEAYEGVEDVLYGERWVEVLDRGLRIVRRANGITGVLSVLAIVLVLGNTLRLIVLMREEPLAIMKMIGATDRFIRVPFVMVGVMLCLIGGVVALLLLYAGHVASGRFLPGLLFLPASSIVLFLLGVGLVGVAGSLLTVEVSIRHLERRGGHASS